MRATADRSENGRGTNPGGSLAAAVCLLLRASRAFLLACLLWSIPFSSAPTLAAEPAAPAKAPTAEPKASPAEPKAATAEPKAAGKTSDQAAAAKPEKAGEQPQDAKSAAAEKSSAADKKSSPQRFVPSEQVRADFDVSFPIDI